MGIGEDSDLEKRIRAAKPNEFVILPVDRESCYTLLRWDSRWEHICLRGYAKMGTTPTSPGHKVLVPHWRVDYVQEVLQRGIMPGMEEPPAARGMVWPAEKVK
jgi:hypothetical protein